MHYRIRDKVRARGAASIEAVVALPVFVILFIGITFMRDLTSAKLTVDQEARRCAWQYAFNDCKEVPAGCEGVVSGAHWADVDINLERPLKKGAGELSNGKNGGATTDEDYQLAGAEKGKSAIKRILSGIITDALAQALTSKFDTNKAAELERPNLFGGGKSQVTGGYRLACNIHPQGGDNLLRTVWNQFRP